MKHKKWDELKKKGSDHYKTGGVQPIDLYRAKNVFQPFALASIIKYATRNFGKIISIKDMVKIKHYTELLVALAKEQDIEEF